jgi:tetratricopeptide (TPR) repeat protein
MITKDRILSALFALLVITTMIKAELSKEQICSLYNQANSDFRQANSTSDTEQAKKLYKKAILGFERIIDEGQVKNAKLYYNLANAYLLHDELGKAILNYRRAENLDGSDENIKKNLSFARSLRTDKVVVKTEKRVLQTLFFWHYDFSIQTKFLLACIFFGIVCLSSTAVLKFGRNSSLLAAIIIFSIITICLISSVIIESKNQKSTINGVITVSEIVAHQGDGQNYPESFKEPLHEGTEFELLERRPQWFHIKLSDDSESWIPVDSAELV